MTKTIAPVLAKKTLPNGYDLTVRGGLNYIRGNKLPYFSITADVTRNGGWVYGGCQHDVIGKHFPEFADIIALHMSDLNGQPIHAKEHGWYLLSGALPDKGDARYYKEGNVNECLGILSKHLRIPMEEVQWLRELVIDSALKGIEKRLYVADAGFAATGVRSPVKTYDWARGRFAFNAFIFALEDIWKHDASMCILRHDLKVFGDAWEGVK